MGLQTNAHAVYLIPADRASRNCHAPDCAKCHEPPEAEGTARTEDPRVYQAAEIRLALEVLAVPGGVVEIRGVDVPTGRGKPCIVAGYFTDLDKAADAAIKLDARRPAGVYVVLNEINPALLARAPNVLNDYLKATTSDNDIIRRRWLPIDLDPQRPSGISSTDAEHDAARAVAEACRDWLRHEAGWSDPILADSGNGWHLLYRIDLPNDETSTALVRDTLTAVAAEFNTNEVDVDQTVFNAARIFKLYGTHARKAYDMPDRPHRLARLIEVPQ